MRTLDRDYFIYLLNLREDFIKRGKNIMVKNVEEEMDTMNLKNKEDIRDDFILENLKNK